MIEYPIIQAPMAGGLLTPGFVAEVANSGCLSFIPGGYLSPDELEDFIKDTKRLTDRPFGVNLFIEQDLYSPHYYKSKTVIDLEKSLGINKNPDVPLPQRFSEADYIKVILKNKIYLVSCTFGVFSSDSITRLRANKVKIWSNVTSLSEAEFSLAKRVDGIILQGAEAGGHQASFLLEEANTTPTMELLKQARARYPETLLIAAGGINSTNLKQYIEAGADYVQIGTEFLLCHEASIPKCYKEYILAHPQTRVTRAITGRYARGVENQLMKQLELSRQILDFPLQHYSTIAIRNYGKTHNNPDYLSLWAGQNLHQCQPMTLKDLLIKLISQCS